MREILERCLGTIPAHLVALKIVVGFLSVGTTHTEPDLTVLAVISPSIPYPLHTLTFGDAYNSIPCFISLRPLPLPAPIGTSNGCSQCRVSVPSIPR